MKKQKYDIEKMYATLRQNWILLTLQWVLYKNMFLDHCCFLTEDLEKIAMSYKLGFHQYADDTQIYGHCDNDGTEELQMRVSERVDEIAA